MKILRGVSGNALTRLSGGTRRLLYVADAIISGYGRLYNWFCTQPQTRVRYGYLYNYPAVIDSRNIAASNAHLPTNEEWTALLNSIDTYNGTYWPNAGTKLKESGFAHWTNDEYSIEGINEYGFTAIGSGVRPQYGSFEDELNFCEFVTSTLYESNLCYYISMSYDDAGAQIGVHDVLYGVSIRFIVDSPIEISGNSAIYVGNDLRRYKCVLINGIWYTAENLAETKYRNGDLIPKVTDNTAWAALTTGAMCAYNNDEANAFETASIAPVGFRVPSEMEWQELIDYCGGNDIAGGKLKETEFTHWNAPNTGATNESEFNLFGAGQRSIDDDFNFVYLKGSCAMRSSTISDDDPTQSFYIYITNFTENASEALIYHGDGASLRLLKNDSTFTPGDTVTDFDGNVYPLVKIGDQVWVAKNWKCTKFNDGTPIPLVEDNTEWSALETPAQCVYENNSSNL